jgi:glycosyltransferase 2 family protein
VTRPTSSRHRPATAVPLLCAAIGLAATAAVVYRAGLHRLVDAMLSIGWRGLVVLLLSQIAMFGILGVAWASILPGGGRWPGLIWARMIRDAAANCLPFSAVGGMVFGTRALALQGVTWPLAAASVVVDTTAEFIGQIVFTFVGFALLLVRAPHSPLTLPLALVLVGAVLAVCGFLRAQSGMARLLDLLTRRIGGRWFDASNGPAARIAGALRGLYARPGVPSLSVALHLVGWIASGVDGWIALHLVGADASFGGAMGIEALLRLAMVAGFIVPAGIGVQEVAYPALAAAFGVPVDMALAVALLRRGRSVAFGLPVLLVSQTLELRRIRDVADVDV